MGNSPPTGGLRPANSDYPGVVNIAPYVAIKFKGKEIYEYGGYEGKSTEAWRVVYNLGKTKCYLTLSKSSKNSMSSSSPTRPDEGLHIEISDGGLQNFILSLERGEDGVLFYPTDLPLPFMPTAGHSRDRTVDANGEITLTEFYFYGSENEQSLVVKEDKWRSKDQNPYTVTVTHYYVNTEDGNNVGLSMAVKNIRVSPNGNFNFTVDGPEEHPAAALIYMIDKVSRTNTWNPTYCHHCAEKIIQRPRTDSEDSNIEKVPATRGHRPTRSLLANEGWFMGGKNNGNLNIRNFFLGLRRRVIRG